MSRLSWRALVWVEADDRVSRDGAVQPEGVLRIPALDLEVPIYEH